MEIIYTPSFIKRYGKLPIGLKKLTESKEELFKKDPFHPSLKTHKLHGKMAGRYDAFSINFRYRISFQFMGDKTIYFLGIGKHDEMYD